MRAAPRARVGIGRLADGAALAFAACGRTSFAARGSGSCLGLRLIALTPPAGLVAEMAISNCDSAGLITLNYAVLQLQAVSRRTIARRGDRSRARSASKRAASDSGVSRGPNIKCGLDHNRAMVEFGGDKVDGGPMKLDAGLQGLLVGVQARKARQQRRMDVQQPARIAVDEVGRQRCA